MTKKVALIAIAGLSAELTEFAKTLSQEQIVAVNEMENDDQRVDYLSLLSEMNADVEILADTETTEIGFSDEGDNTPILTFGAEGDVKAGDRISGRLIGTLPIFTKEKKENWEVRMVKGVKYYFNYAFVIATTTGRKFAIFQSPMLRILGKVITPDTCNLERSPVSGRLLSKEPVTVQIQYDGKKTKAELEKDYGLKMEKGTEGHAFVVRLSKNAVIEKYAKGVLNWTRKPEPIVAAVDERDMFEVNDENYDLMNAAPEANTKALGGGEVAQIENHAH